MRRLFVFQSCLIVFQSSYIILHSHQQHEFQFLHIFANTCYVIFDLGHPSECEVVMQKIMLNILSSTDWPFVYLSWKQVHSDPLPIFNGLSASLILKGKSSYIYSGDKSFIIWFAYIFFLYDFHFLSSAF